VPKKQTRKLQRKLIPMIPMMQIDELMAESNTFSKFNKTVELVFENMEDIDMKELEAINEDKDDAEIPPEILINKFQLSDLCSETAKLKSLGVMESVSQDKLVKLLNILELNIRDGSRVIPLSGDEDEEEDALWLEMAMERVMRGADASLVAMHILTSKKMGKRIYIDDVIDRVALFLRFQLSNTIYPSYDTVYKEISKSKTGYVGSMKKKRSYASSGPRDRNILSLYNKTHELASLMAELVKMQLLTDTTILHISTMGVAPFFVENIPELQLAALKLVTNLFSKYEKHRKLLLDDILASIARLPSSKRSLRTYRLDTTTHIQMLTALVLQLIQCTVVLPRRLAFKDKKTKEKKDPEVIDLDGSMAEELDRDVLINTKYSDAMATAHQFLTVFLKKCGSKNEDIDYRPLFENFVQDLLTTVNKPLWPAAELLLSLLGRVLREKFSDRGVEMPLRISSLEYLGVVAARLRKDAVQSKMKVDYIDSIVQSIKEEEDKEGEDSAATQEERKLAAEDPEDERNIFLQRVLLDYMTVNCGEDDQAAMNARHFYISQWYRDANAMGRKPKARKKVKTAKKQQSKKKQSRDDSSSEDDGSAEEVENSGDDEDQLSDSKKAELYRLREARKDFLVGKIPPFGVSRAKDTRAQLLSTHVDATSAHLVVKYLSSKRPFFNSFNYYLRDILNVLTEQSTHIRTKALKCMTLIVTEDSEVLFRKDMKDGVNYSFTDSSTMVREAAVDLVGKFILHDEDLIEQYYKTITSRILVSS
jgi:cohesin loading factor subunit SCC2